ncbi:hypothetical protein ATANTOWER_007217 [Ataeniobius toweri]|uniref:Uncharacterized protein n=1 Tax=Ataeniobius toweri TaxID=208326 RepID=A0ABU7CHH5_9TELE|nr:hypothetical protein [Ataeniobius toweri]
MPSLTMSAIHDMPARFVPACHLMPRKAIQSDLAAETGANMAVRFKGNARIRDLSWSFTGGVCESDTAPGRWRQERCTMFA